MRRRTRTNEKKQSLDEIHEAINDFMSKASTVYAELKDNHSVPSIEDALQAIETVSRPKTSLDIENLGKTVLNAVLAAGNDQQSWKLLSLTIVHRRYHSKAPEAQSIKESKNKEKGDHDIEIGSGHGERLSFYLMFMYFQVIARNKQLLVPLSDFSLKACECLARLALPAGGTRDVCALIEHLVYEELDQSKICQLQKEKGKKRALCQAVTEFVVVQKDSTQISPVLTELLQIASNLIDQDLNLIDSNQDKVHHVVGVTSGNEKKKQKVSLKVSEEGEFQSTINTFIPHHNRGTNARKLVQTVAELMIWSQTISMKADTKFSSALADLSTVLKDDDKIVPYVHTLQTAIRRTRKKLNASSREQGFSLCTSFEMNHDSITLGMIKSAKHGDVTRLQMLATKANDLSVAGLIANRFIDPSKAIPASSILALKNNWVHIGDKDVNEDDELPAGDELTKLRLQMQEATVKATIELLRRKVPKSCNKGNAIIASLDRTAEVDGAAILVAAALETNCTNEPCTCSEKSVVLYLGEEECSMSSFSDVLNLLDKVFADEMTPNHSRTTSPDHDLATTKDIQNLINRHLQPGGSLLLFAASDVKLEQRVLKNLQERGSTVHCHVIDEFALRMEREQAKVGDITVTLAWDNECDLDLSAKCPNGDLIYYGNKSGGTGTGGGYLDVDMNVSGESKEPVENIFFGDAENGISADHGHYKILVRNYGYHGKTVKSGDPVPWRVRLSKDGKCTHFTGVCVGSGESSEMIVVEFDYEGRTKLAPKAVGSALSSSNLVYVTSSRGISMDSISELMTLREQHAELDTVRNLIDSNEDNELEVPPDLETEPEQSQAAESRPLMADRKYFDITNRDRLYLNLSKLPSRFHLEVNRSFQGGSTLLDYTASVLAKRLIEDRVHVDELKKAGYQADLVDVVRKKMTTFGVGS